MDIRRLRYFIAVAETLSFSRAAESLGMTQPPVSQRVRELETDLKADLLLRGKRGLTLTPLGEKLFHLARPLVQDFDRLMQPVTGEASGASVCLVAGGAEPLEWPHKGSAVDILAA